MVGDQTSGHGLCRSLYLPPPLVAHGSGPTDVSCTTGPIAASATYGQEVARPSGGGGVSCTSLGTRNGGRRVGNRGRKGDRGAPGRPRIVQRAPPFRRNSVRSDGHGFMLCCARVQTGKRGCAHTHHGARPSPHRYVQQCQRGEARTGSRPHTKHLGGVAQRRAPPCSLHRGALCVLTAHLFLC